jgi:hypothetical protein
MKIDLYTRAGGNHGCRRDGRKLATAEYKKRLCNSPARNTEGKWF